MSKIDKKYHKLLKKILKKGTKYEDPNRKGVQRIQIPSYTIKHDFKDGFPAITTKKLYWKGVVGELIWFLRGDTNIKYLVDNGINIWNKDAYNYRLRFDTEYAPSLIIDYDTFIDEIKVNSEEDLKAFPTGLLGRIYGAQWRHFRGVTFDEDCEEFLQLKVDQISNLIKGLKENPMGTQHIVTAWNPAELDQMALPPCHWSFEILVEEIQAKDAINYCKSTSPYRQLYNNKLVKDMPKYQFTLKWHQRSVDTFLGLPFNIASYALLAQIIGKLTNMIPKGIVGDLSNVHIYEPHLDAVREQLSRDVDGHKECELVCNSNIKYDYDKGKSLTSTINDLDILDFELLKYESYPRIPAEMLAYNK